MTAVASGESQLQGGPGGPGGPAAGGAEVERKYWRMFVILALLPVLSVSAYLTGIRSLAIFTAILVIAFSTYFATTTFMHVDMEPRFVAYLCILAFVFSAMYLFLAAPDVMMHSGQQWVNIEAEKHEQHSGHGAGAPAHGDSPTGPAEHAAPRGDHGNP